MTTFEFPPGPSPLWPADVAPREKVQSWYQCSNTDCENGPSNGYPIARPASDQPGLCEPCLERSKQQ